MEKKKKFSWKTLGGILLLWLICGIMGYFLGMYVDKTAPANYSGGQELGYMLFVIACVFVGLYLQIIIHEGGHLVFGLLSGYGFSSFRVGSLMLLRENGKMKVKKLTIAGTGGQCLMTPPDMVDGKFPVMLYNLGGALANLAASAVAFGILMLLPAGGLWSNLCLGMTFTGVYLALLNGIPMRISGQDNDGRNALSIGKNADAMGAFWLQMKVNEQIAKGIRLKDMNDAWFTVPDEAAMKNPMVAAQGVFACNRLMDQHRFGEADALMKHLLEIESGMAALHRNLLVCDRMYLELIGQNRGDVLDEMYSKEQKQFMKAMKNFPTVLRTEYTYALLDAKDPAMSEQIKAKFEKIAKTYPYPNDIQSERELMEIAENTLNA